MTVKTPRYSWKGGHDAERCPHCRGSGFRPVRGTLTRRQAELYRFLVDWSTINGYAPSFEEIAESFGYNSLATVHEHLATLERKGFIARRYNESRSILCLVPLNEMAGVVAAPAAPQAEATPEKESA